MTPRRLFSVAAGLVSATPVAMWWVVGDLDERGADDRDRMFRPFSLPPLVETVAGVLAVLVVIAAVIVLGLAWYRWRLPAGWARRLGMLCTAGAIVGGGWRVLTASAVGANIGGGAVLVFGFPLAALLVVAAAMDADRD